MTPVAIVPGAGDGIGPVEVGVCNAAPNLDTPPRDARPHEPDLRSNMGSW